MSYRLVISPTAGNALGQLVQQHPFPSLLTQVGDILRRFAETPAAFVRGTRRGRPFFILRYTTPDAIVLNLRVFYRFTLDETAIEILDISPVVY